MSTSVVMSVGWCALVLGAGWHWRPSPASSRLAAIAGRPAPSADGSTALGARPARRLDEIAAAAGHQVRRLARRPSDSASDGEADRRCGRALIAGLVTAVIAVPLAAAVALAVWVVPVQRRNRDRRRHAVEVGRELPEVVDLFLLAASGGLNVSLALVAVGRRSPPVLGAALRRASDEIDLGARTADVLEATLGPFGDPVRPLLAALVSAERYGAPLVPTLERLAGEVRIGRRRRAEEAARRVPVKLLFPLVLCTLPAFVLLTVVPLLVGTLRGLRL